MVVVCTFDASHRRQQGAYEDFKLHSFLLFEYQSPDEDRGDGARLVIEGKQSPDKGGSSN